MNAFVRAGSLRAAIWILIAMEFAGTAAPAQPLEILSLTHLWRYEGSGADLGTTWQSLDYNDSAWPDGRGVIAAMPHNSIVQALTQTSLSRNGTNGQFKITDYFRARFTVPSLQSGWFIMASNLVDDGAVFYLNGSEWFRVNMLPGPVNARTFAAQTIGEGREGIFAVTNLPAAGLVAGENVLAVEVHQPYVTSTDTVLGVVLLYARQEPLEITRQPMHRVAAEGTPATFSVEVAGSLPRYQWFKDGIAIANATQRVLSLAGTRRGDAGQYFVVASNEVGAVTSRVAVLTLSLDARAPTLVSARRNLYLDVRFSEPIDFDSATNPASYRITAPGGGALAVSNVFIFNEDALALETAPLLPGFAHLLFVTGVRDRFGNVIEPESGIEIGTNAGSGPPLILTQPHDLTVNERSPASFLAHVAGADTTHWLHNGTRVPGGSNYMLGIPVAGVDADGGYSLRASNSFGIVTSRVARLSVVPDRIPPRLLGARSGTNETQALLAFSEPLDPASVAALGNYTITDELGGPLAVLNAGVTNGTNILLTTTPRAPGHQYTVAVKNVRDISAAGNAVVANGHTGLDFETLLFSYDKVWRYHESGTNLGTAWRDSDYEDIFWQEGPGLLAFENAALLPAPLRTALTPPDFTGITAYFRTRFNFTGDPASAALRLRHVIDDGAVFYLNGREVHRIRVPEGQNYTTTTTMAVEAQVEGPFDLPDAALVVGENVLAAEVHQVTRTSADIVFGAELTLGLPVNPSAPAGPSLQLQRTASGFALYWDALDFALEQADAPSGPWEFVSQPTWPHLVSPSGSGRFFRLRGQLP